LQGEGEADGQAKGRWIGELGVWRRLTKLGSRRRPADFGGVRADPADNFQRVLAGFPILVTAEPPMREVWFVDGLAVKPRPITAATSGSVLSHATIRLPSWPSCRRRLICSRMGCGSRAILPFLVIKEYFWLNPA
jgi:hypothetical protein